MLSTVTNHSQVAARKMLLVQIIFLSQMSLVEDTRLIKKTELMNTGRIVNILSACKDRIWRDLWLLMLLYCLLTEF